MTPNSYDLLDHKPLVVTYRNMNLLFWYMLEHWKTHPGTRFERADRKDDMLVGFWDPAQGVSWHISVDDLKRAHREGDIRCAALWKTPSLRDALAVNLSQGLACFRPRPSGQTDSETSSTISG